MQHRLHREGVLRVIMRQGVEREVGRALNQWNKRVDVERRGKNVL